MPITASSPKGASQQRNPEGLPLRLDPVRDRRHDGIGTKRPASRDLSRGAVRQTHQLREIERLTATNHNRQRIHQQKAKPSGATLGAWSPNKSSLYDVIQNRQQTRKPDANLYANDLSSSRHPRIQKETWWSRTGSNRRHPACKAGALPAELRPLIPVERKWWAWEDLNLRPHAYQARALTN